MEMILRLKEETRELHEQIEEKNLAKQIMSHNIDLETYKLLLFQNFIAYYYTETQIEKFLPNYKGRKHLQLRKDLEQLQISAELPFKNDIFECHSLAEAFGAAYVVEGSALGGLVIAKNLDKCPALDPVDEHYFFNGNKNNLEDWRNFKIQLEAHTFSESEEKEALEKAKETFQFFDSVFSRRYELI